MSTQSVTKAKGGCDISKNSSNHIYAIFFFFANIFKCWSLVRNNLRHLKSKNFFCKKGNAWIPTFEDFLEAVSFYPEDMYNKHWSPMWTICEPCLVDYDVITKTETMDEDFKYLQKKWNEKLKVPAFHAYSDTKMDYNNYEENLLKIYKNVSRKVIEKLVEVYEWDFKLFGYDPKPFLRNKN